MFFIPDIAVALLFLVAVIVCTARGFVKSVAGIVRIVGAFLLAKLFGGLLGKLLALHVIGPAVYDWLEAEVSALAGESLSALFSENGEAFRTLLVRFDASEQLDALRAAYGEGTEAVESTVSTLVRDFATPWVERLSTAIGCVIVFVVAFVLIFFLTKLLIYIVERVDILNRTNHALGFLLGIVAGIYAVIALCYAVNLIASVLAFAGSSAVPILTVINSSAVFRPIYEFVMGIR